MTILKVCKFGGSSLANADQIRKVCDIVLADSTRRILVVSAPGKRSREDIKVTDLLIALANAKLNGYDGIVEEAAVLRRFHGICEDLELDSSVMAQITERIQSTATGDQTISLRYIDAMKALGEDCCARLVAAYLNKLGHSAHYVNPGDAGLYLSDEFGHAEVLPESYENLAELAHSPALVVFPGFYGLTKNGDPVTFSRGGSDITGSILTAATRASVYENWTDVDYVYTVNPTLVPHPAPIREISYREMRELAYIGFSIIHPDALLPVFNLGIPINIRNTNNPKTPGTWIVQERTRLEGVVTGIAAAQNFCCLNITEYLLNRHLGVTAKILTILKEEHVALEHIPTGVDSISLVMRESSFTPERERRIRERLRNELNLTHLSTARGLAVVMLVGDAMGDSAGRTAARALNRLSNAGVAIDMIINDYSGISLLFIVDNKYCTYAVEELYREFFQQRGNALA